MPLPGGLKAFEQLDLERELVKKALASELFSNPAQRVRLGRFEVLRKIGQGDSGAVYEAFDPVRGTNVAVKMLTRVDARYIYRLKREFRALADVIHPNLVQFHELFCEDERWFFSMEQVHGVQFDQWVHTHQGLDRFTRLRAALAQLSAAVQALHAAGKLHRDLKPSNVHVTPEGRVVVLDFGLVEQSVPEIGGDAQSGLCGTPAYLAPEQAAGERATPASDYYAIGVMLYEVLTGALPFAGALWLVLDDKQHKSAPDPSALAPDLPHDLCQLCRSLLQRDPALRADGRDIDALVSAYADGASLPSPAPSRLFVGRERELDALHHALGALAGGTPGAVLLSGPSGIGKSALLRSFDEHVSARGALVLSGRCHERESVPFKVFDGVVDALSDHLRRLSEDELALLLPRQLGALLQLFPVLARCEALARGAANGTRPTTSDALELRKRAFASFKELLLRLSDRQPVLLAVDDLQWGDRDSSRLLTYLLSPPDPAQLLFVGAYRVDEASSSDFLRGISTADGEREPIVSVRVRAARIDVGPLPPPVAAELARALLAPESRSDAGLCEAIALEADGVPYLIAELAQHEPSQAEAAGRRASLSLEQVILQRVARLPDAAQHLLHVVSVAAGPVEQGIALRAARVNGDARSLLSALRAARLLRSWGARPSEVIETYHDRVRNTVVQHIPADALRAIHAQLAQAIRDTGPHDPERLVTHYTGAGQYQAAGAMAVEAALAATRNLAFHRAAQLFARAIDLLPDADQDRLNLHQRLGDALANAGRGAAAAEAYLHAADRGGGPGTARLRRLAAQQYLRSGRAAAGIALTREVFSGAGISLPDSQLGMTAAFLTERARLRMRGLRLGPCDATRGSPRAAARVETLSDLCAELTVIDTLKGALLQTRYLREALAAGDPQRALHAMTWEVFNVSLLGGARNRRRADAVMTAARQLAAEIDTPYAQGAVRMAEASRLLWNGRNFQDACAPALAAEEIFSKQCQGAFWERALVVYIRLLCLEFCGDLQLQAAAALEMLRESAERDDRFTALLMLLAVPYTYLMRDDPRSARDFLDAQRGWLGPGFTTFHYQWWMRMIQTETYAGAADRGLALFESQWPLFRRSHLARCEFVLGATRIFAIRCALAAYHQNPDPAMRRKAHRLIAATANTDTGYGAYRQAFIGSLQVADGDRSGAVQSLQAACDRLLDCQATLIRVYAGRVLAQQRGDASEVARVDAELQRQGVVNPARWAWNHMPSGPPP